MFAELLAGHAPLAFNCSAGKDRTLGTHEFLQGQVVRTATRIGMSICSWFAQSKSCVGHWSDPVAHPDRPKHFVNGIAETEKDKPESFAMASFGHSSQTGLTHSPPQGELTISVDCEQSVIKVVGHGFWSIEYAIAHIRDFTAVVERVRQKGRALRTLVDLRAAQVQALDVTAYLHDAISKMYHPPERAAVVVNSNLAKLQMQRGFNPETHAVFLSLYEAERWLGVQ